MCNFGVEEMFDLYKSVYRKARNNGCDDKEAGNTAWKEVCEICPDIAEGTGYIAGKDRTTLLAWIGGFRWSAQTKEGVPTEAIKLQEKSDNESITLFFEGLNWKDCWRKACATGFVPYKDYVMAFLPDEKTSQWSSYKRFMEYEGYVFEAAERGWNVTFIEPEPPETRQKQEIQGPQFYVTRELIEGIVQEVVNKLTNK